MRSAPTTDSSWLDSYPFHHRPTFLARLAAKEHHTNKAFFANVMSICALAAARLRDGATPCEIRTDPTRFAKAVKESFPKELTATRGLDYMRTCAVMAIYKVQDGQRDEMQEYLGMYLSIVTMDNLGDESKWPKDLTYVEVEERRRLVSAGTTRPFGMAVDVMRQKHCKRT